MQISRSLLYIEYIAKSINQKPTIRKKSSNTDFSVQSYEQLKI